MTEVKVDCEKLSDCLENGLDPKGVSSFRRLSLRMPRCGLVATAINLHLKGRGVNTEAVVSEPDLSFDPFMQHWVSLVKDDLESPLLIDGTYGQFLKYKGYEIPYDYILNTDLFPEARVVAFRLSEREAAVRDIARMALRFPPMERELLDRLGCIEGAEPGYDWIPNATTEEAVAAAIGPIWNPDNFYQAELNSVTMLQAEALSKYIDDDAIVIE
jgi:hypothetical protein